MKWHWPYRENDPLGGKDPYSAGGDIMIGRFKESLF